MRARWNPQYHQRVLATDPIAYWVQDEKQGLVSYDMVTARDTGARNGAYTGVTLGQPGIGDGRASPFFDGVNDFNNILTPDLIAVLDPTEFTVLVWFQVANAGVWTDGIDRTCLWIANAANTEFIQIAKPAAANQLAWFLQAGGVFRVRFLATSVIGWHSAVLTVSETADEMRAYLDGVQIGATINGLGAWVAVVTQSMLFALTVAPAQPWHGWGAHIAIWDRALTPEELS